MKNYILLLSTLVFGLFAWGQPANDDCGSATTVTDLDGTCNTYNNSGATLDAPPANLVGSCFTENNTSWFQFTAQGNQVTVDISSTVNKFNPEIVIFGDTDGDICDGVNGFELDCNLVGIGNYGTISASAYPLTVGDTYWIMIVSDSEGNYDICIDNPPNDPGDNCLTAEPFCTDEVSTFDAATDAVAIDDADYNCLETQPNPKWFYLEIDDPGDLEITMSNTENNDIDFALWGPVTDLESGCDTGIQEEPVDCSYLTLTTEVGTASGTSTGDLYILVVTNFENSETVISVEQTDGSASTNCAIVLPVELLTFDVSNQHNTNIITWSTATEKNNDYFEVEYSNNGIDWRLIDTVSGSGTSSKKKNYSLMHRDFSNSINYYRLRQVDYNGEVDIFDPISIDNTDGREVVKTINLMGQEVDETYSGIVIIKYSDGTSTKTLQK